MSAMLAKRSYFALAASIAALVAYPAAAQSDNSQPNRGAAQAPMQGPPAPSKPSAPQISDKDPTQVEGSVPLGVMVPSDALSRVTVYGNDPCPRGHGDEIVVCAREPESERYRVPKRLREARKNGEAWGSRASSLEYVGASGIQSCSPSGAGGW